MARNENATAATVNTENAAVTESKPQNLIVERSKFKGKDGKDYWGYVVNGKVRGRDIKVDFSAKDQGRLRGA